MGKSSKDCTCKDFQIVTTKPKYNGNILNTFLNESFGKLEQRLEDISIECRNKDGTVKQTIDIFTECAKKLEEFR